MENKKMTKKEMFGEVIALATENGRQDIVDFANHEIELLNKKSGKSSQTKTQVENENIKAQIVNALREIGKSVTITELQAQNSEMANYSNQKLSALLKQLVENNEVSKTTDKKKSYFSVVA